MTSTTAERTDPLTEPALTRSGAARLDVIDLLRGLVIILMVLDHARDYFHAQAFIYDPVDPVKSNLAVFGTRWITHLCAPTFVLLSGVSAYLQRVNGKRPATLSRFLLTRGLWLVFLEVAVVSLGFNFGPVLFMQVIWAIGASMVLLAALTWAPPLAVGALGAAIIIGHPALAGIDAADLGQWGLLWGFMMELTLIPNLGFVAYPLLPWAGVMFLGYGLGGLFLKPTDERRRTTLFLALGMLAAFVLLRAPNLYGDPAPWSGQADAARTAMSFLNVTKYPPSLLYVLATLGVSLLLSLALERLKGFPAKVLLAFGRTPLFTYVLHLYILHLSALAIAAAMGFDPMIMVNFVVDPSRAVKAGWGFSLAGAYVAWALTLAALYPLSAWFAGVKRRRRDWWLSYL
ncbi:heparan-alpha-glucosaminide N-acetyltransferase domain-containing protein [Caulobacter sp. 73W]|uniref:Heparan-alpha-glucosaminide N-acetyltransferase domain-containing protein n=1 Tax=Caulobacter sp. 73W TaxID=3161137 RepID=A0AB39KQ59_9CAUL